MVRRHEIPKILLCPRVYYTRAKLRADDHLEAIHIDGRVARRSIPCRDENRTSSLLRWPLPTLRPERAAYGVAGLRSGSGQRDSKRALMT